LRQVTTETRASPDPVPEPTVVGKPPTRTDQVYGLGLTERIFATQLP